MAEFAKTMKDWKRMCNEMERERPHDACSGCPLEGYGCPAIYEDNSRVDFADVEKSVTAWATEHPEPVYPTWGEWLCDMHVVGVQARQVPLPKLYYTIESAMHKPIPADIAQKLGIEPKEA